MAKHTDQNYQAWKFKVKTLLISANAWKYIDDVKLLNLSTEWKKGDFKA